MGSVWLLRAVGGLAILIGITAAAAGLYFRGYWVGRQDATAVWEERAREMAARYSAQLEQAARESVKVVTQYQEKVKIVRVQGETIREQVPVLIPQPVLLSPGFRVLHDAAAVGIALDAGAAERAYATADPVAESTAVEAILENYESCHLNAAQLSALQEWIRAQLPKGQ